MIKLAPYVHVHYKIFYRENSFQLEISCLFIFNFLMMNNLISLIKAKGPAWSQSLLQSLKQKWIYTNSQLQKTANRLGLLIYKYQNTAACS